MGNGLGWSSPALASIKCAEDKNGTILPPGTNGTMNYCLDADEQKWTGSLLCIGALIASQVNQLHMIHKTALCKTI